MIKLNVSNLDNLRIHMHQWSGSARERSPIQSRLDVEIDQMQDMEDAIRILESVYDGISEENKMYMLFWSNLVQSGSERTMRGMSWEEIKREVKILWAQAVNKLGDSGLDDVLRL